MGPVWLVRVSKRCSEPDESPIRLLVKLVRREMVFCEVRLARRHSTRPNQVRSVVNSSEETWRPISDVVSQVVGGVSVVKSS